MFYVLSAPPHTPSCETTGKRKRPQLYIYHQRIRHAHCIPSFFYRAMNQLLTYIRHIFLSTSILPLPVLLILFIFLLLVLHIITAIDKYISLSLLIFLSPYLCFTHTHTNKYLRTCPRQKQTVCLSKRCSFLPCREWGQEEAASR